MRSVPVLFVLSAAALAAVDATEPRLMDASLDGASDVAEGVAKPASFEGQLTDRETFRGKLRRSVFPGSKSVVRTIQLLGAAAAVAAISFLMWKCFKNADGKESGSDRIWKRRLAGKDPSCGPGTSGGNGDAFLDEAEMDIEMRGPQVDEFKEFAEDWTKKLEKGDPMYVASGDAIKAYAELAEKAASVLQGYKEAVKAYADAKANGSGEETMKTLRKKVKQSDNALSAVFKKEWKAMERVLEQHSQWREANLVEERGSPSLSYSEWSDERGRFLGAELVASMRRQVAMEAGDELLEASADLGKKRAEALQAAEKEYKAFLELQARFFQLRDKLQEDQEEASREAAKEARGELSKQKDKAEAAFKKLEETIKELGRFERQWLDQHGKPKPPYVESVDSSDESGRRR